MAEAQLDEEEWKSEEFPCPPGRITVDLVDEDGNQGRGIHIYFFDPTVSDADMLKHTIMPNKRQWNHVKPQVLEWLEGNLE